MLRYFNYCIDKNQMYKHTFLLTIVSYYTYAENNDFSFSYVMWIIFIYDFYIKIL